MEQVIAYYNNHVQAEAQGMSVDWFKVAKTMAVLVQSLIDKPSIKEPES